MKFIHVYGILINNIIINGKMMKHFIQEKSLVSLNKNIEKSSKIRFFVSVQYIFLYFLHEHNIVELICSGFRLNIIQLTRIMTCHMFEV